MNRNMILFIFGLILGYIMMFVTSNIVVYHAPNSRKVREKIFLINGRRYSYVPVKSI